jgi:multiple sugar transport system substrate-binding protein
MIGSRKREYRILRLVLTGGILLFPLLFSLIGCADKKSEVAEITFWGMGTEGEKIQTLIPEFQKRNPGIKVKVQMVPWTAAQEKLISSFAADNTPDICQLGNTWVPQFVMLEALELLDKFITSSKSLKDSNYFEGIWKTNEISGKIYGIPWYIDTRIIYYRKDIFEKVGYKEPPKSWAELYDLSKKIVKYQNNPNKYAIYLPTNEWASFVIFALQNNADILKDNWTYGNFSGNEFLEAFKFLIKFHKERLTPMGVSQVTNVYQAFQEEFFAMYISGPWNIPEFKKWMKDSTGEKWGTMPLPGKNGFPGVSLAGGSSLVMFKNSKNKEAVWKFIEFLSEKKTQLEFYNATNNLPAVKSAWDSPVFQNDIFIKAFYDQFQHVVPTPKIAEWEQIVFSKLQQYAEYAARGTMSEEEAMKQLDQDVNQILEKRRWLISRY